MIGRGLTESTVERAALGWLDGIGYSVLHGLKIAVGEPGAADVALESGFTCIGLINGFQGFQPMDLLVERGEWLGLKPGLVRT